MCETSLMLIFFLRYKLGCKTTRKKQRVQRTDSFCYKHQYCTKAAYLDEHSALQNSLSAGFRSGQLPATSDMHKYSIKIHYGKNLQGL